ncbi:MAG TPA: hypothetical protein VMT38_02270 [Terracidiphilus sp.]|nr:hypothetical protein [Terracidiphilus sp.]
MKPLHRLFTLLTAAVTGFGACSLARAGGPASSPAGDGSLTSEPAQTIVIPGPLRSFLRMAGISQESAPSEVLPLLARNAFLYGRQMGKKTEYLVLEDRYVQQARELQPLAVSNGAIPVTSCSDAQPLIQVLGYQFQSGCGRDGATLVTANAERAFLTMDSGFPLTRLEQSLKEGNVFTYPFPATRVPILFHEKDWLALIPAKERGGATLLDLLLNDENADRLYSAFSRLDPETRNALFQSPGLKRLLFYGPVLDFYGSRICVRSGAVVLPGGEAARRAWEELVGANSNSPGDFVLHLLAKDQGWLAAYFDALARVSPEQQAQLTRGNRLKDLYGAYRASVPGVNAASSVFARNSTLLLLFNRIQWNAAGEPLVPGDLAVWKEVFAREERLRHSHERDWTRRLQAADGAQGFLEAQVAFSNVAVSDGPTQIYLALTAIDAARPADRRLTSDLARLLAAKYPDLSDWYPIFVEFPALDDDSIRSFIAATGRINGISNQTLRSNTLGAFQAEVGIWQILARQRQIGAGDLNTSWKAAIQPYSDISSSIQLFDAARTSLRAIVKAAGGSGDLTEDEVVDLLAGPQQTNPDAAQVHEQMARRMRGVLDDQRLASLNTLFGLYDGLAEMSRGAKVGDSLLPLAGTLREFELPRPIFTEGERVNWSPAVYVSRHAELQVRTDLTKVIKAPGTPAQLEAARGKLAPFLRDTLVGLIYAYYEPPGAQVLHSNPLFVRSHDFSASSIQGINQIWGAPSLIGIGATAGGGAYLIGSLADLPYVLAMTEEDFISPEKVQALIWRETVPELLVNATVPRWWGISRDELHAVNLYQRAGEELLRKSVNNPALREKVVAIFGERMGWGRTEELAEALEHQQTADSAIAKLVPTDTFYLEATFRKKYPDQIASWGPANSELDALAGKNPADTAPEKIAHDFGVPHLTLADSDACNLLAFGPFPVAGGQDSRLFGESWESGNLYWARLVDEKGYDPATLNVVVPVLTRQMVANISATTIDDWPALQRAMNETGEEFMKGQIAIRPAGIDLASTGTASGGSEQ